MIRLLEQLFRRDARRPPALDPPWNVLNGTGNGIGGAPASLRSVAAINDEAFDKLYCGELVDRFWHQGTIYAATPFAIAELLRVLPATSPQRAADLLRWFGICLYAESLGEQDCSRAGVCFPAKDKLRLQQAGVARPLVQEVLSAGLAVLRRYEEAAQPQDLRDAARRLMDAVKTPSLAEVFLDG